MLRLHKQRKHSLSFKASEGVRGRKSPRILKEREMKEYTWNELLDLELKYKDDPEVFCMVERLKELESMFFASDDDDKDGYTEGLKSAIINAIVTHLAGVYNAHN